MNNNLFKNLIATVNALESHKSTDGSPFGAFYEYHEIPDSQARGELYRLQKLLPYKLHLIDGPWIAGGCARRLLQEKSILDGDIDLFFPAWRVWHKWDKALEEQEVIMKTSRAHTYMIDGFKVQIIKRKSYQQLRDLFQDFDFSACQIATDGNRIACTRSAYRDIKNNVLDYATQGRVTGSTILGRMIKYINHGFIPSPEMFSHIVDSGLDDFGHRSIFSTPDGLGESSVYDLDDETPENDIAADEMDSTILRSVAQRMGLLTNVE